MDVGAFMRVSFVRGKGKSQKASTSTPGFGAWWSASSLPIAFLQLAQAISALGKRFRASEAEPGHKRMEAIPDEQDHLTSRAQYLARFI
nr:hypothetical protein [uncultured Cohaesibacter sp.]